MQLKSLSQKNRSEFWEALNDICSDSVRTLPSESCNQKCFCGQGSLEIILTFFWKQNLRWSKVLSSRMFSFLHCLTEVKCTPAFGTVCLRWTVLLEEKKKQIRWTFYMTVLWKQCKALEKAVHVHVRRANGPHSACNIYVISNVIAWRCCKVS